MGQQLLEGETTLSRMYSKGQLIQSGILRWPEHVGPGTTATASAWPEC